MSTKFCSLKKIVGLNGKIFMNARNLMCKLEFTILRYDVELTDRRKKGGVWSKKSNSYGYALVTLFSGRFFVRNCHI